MMNRFRNLWYSFKVTLVKQFRLSPGTTWKSFIYNTLSEGFVSFCVIHAFTTSVIGFSFCSGPSMLPTLDVNNQIVFIEKFRYKTIYWEDYKVGDVVISTSKEDPYKNVCKRVKAVAGDHVVYNIDHINGTVSHMTVPMGHVWLAGDNISNSNDSRMYGPMPIGMLQGRVFLKIGLNPLHMTSIDTIVLNDKYPTVKNDNIRKKCLNLTKNGIYEDDQDKKLKSYVLNNSNIIHDNDQRQKQNINKQSSIDNNSNNNMNHNNIQADSNINSSIINDVTNDNQNKKNENINQNSENK